MFIFQGNVSIFGKESKRKDIQGRICEGISYGDLCPAYNSQQDEMCVRMGKNLFYSSLKLLEQDFARLVTSSDEIWELPWLAKMQMVAGVFRSAW